MGGGGGAWILPVELGWPVLVEDGGCLPPRLFRRWRRVVFVSTGFLDMQRSVNKTSNLRPCVSVWVMRPRGCSGGSAFRTILKEVPSGA